MKQRLKDLVQFIMIFVFVFTIQTFVVGITKVEGVSMVPTLNNGKNNDRVVVERISNYMHNYRRGEVIIFKPYDNEDDRYIKRIIGLPGDIVKILKGKVYVNDKELNEDYLDKNTETQPEMKIKVDKDCVFVLGDNRMNSMDSREIGTIPMKKIKGHAIFRFNILKIEGNRLN
ncbi:signal peptidase I [Haloimpatiens sp. FM7330]|uniref:signal peptidase I n=1 Tax=Haloimpatiens sp. FM7330 TaxID=3298610 RepID=UPI0036290668